jgi:hypothetical protein
MGDLATCRACGHENHATEMYVQFGPDGGGHFCRNHNSCQTRSKARWATQREEATMQFEDHTPPPAETTGDKYRPRDNYGNSAIVVAREHKESVVTPNSPNGAPALICDIYDLNQKRAYVGVLLMGPVQRDLRNATVGKARVVKWERAVSNGRDYARAAEPSPAAVDAAKNVYANEDPFMKESAGEEEAPF